MKVLKFEVCTRRKDGSGLFKEVLTIDQLLNRNGCYYSPSIQEVFYRRQYLGIKDKFGNELFDGDFIKYIRQYGFLDDALTGEPIDEDRTRIIIGRIYKTPMGNTVIKGYEKTVSDVTSKVLSQGKYYNKPSLIGELSEVIGNEFENPNMLENLATKLDMRLNQVKNKLQVS